MIENTERLLTFLQVSGILASGCNSDGKVWDNQNNEIQTRPDVAAVIAAYDPNPTEQELAVIARKSGAKTIAQSANDWFAWDLATALGWIDTNIGTPLANGRTNLPATLTLASARVAFVALLDILDKVLVLLIALTRVVYGLRDDKWPER